MSRTKQKELLLEWYKTPFDEDDAAALCNSEEGPKDYTEMAMIWAFFRAAELIDNYHKGALKTFKKIMAGDLLDEDESLPESTQISELTDEGIL